MDSTSDMLRDMAGRLFAEHCTREVLRDAEKGIWPAAAWRALEDAALSRALVPEAAGGFGVAVADALGLLRIAGEHTLPLPLAETLLASWLLAGASLAVPEGPLTVAPVTTSDRLHLVRDGARWRIEGVATRVPWGRASGIGVAVLAEHEGVPWVAFVRAGEFTAMEAENVAREPRDTLSFTAAIDADDARPTVFGVGPEQLRLVGAAMRSLQIAGALTRLVDTSTQYAQERVQFGRPIGKFQAIQHSLAVMATQAAAAVAASDFAAEAVADGIRPLPIAAAKARASEAAGIAAGLAHQVHGAIGFTYEHHLHFITKRLWSWRDEWGNEAAWNLVVGQYMARAGADQLWPEITAA